MIVYALLHNRMGKRSQRSQNTWPKPMQRVRACSIHPDHVSLHHIIAPVVAEIYTTDLCDEEDAEARVRGCALVVAVQLYSAS